MTNIIGEFLHDLFSFLGLALSIHRVIKDLKSTPIRLSTKEIIHFVLSSFITMEHDPSVELSKPDLLQLSSDLSGRVFVDHLRELGSLSVILIVALTTILHVHHENLVVKECSEILSNG